jgi:penicillin-binding protein 1B
VRFQIDERISLGQKLPVRLKLPKNPLAFTTFGKVLLISVGVLFAAAMIVFVVAYTKYSRLTDQKLTEGPFPHSSMLYAGAQETGIGDPGTPLEFAGRLREAGLAEDVRTNSMGWYHLRPDAIEVFPGPDSYTGVEPGVIRFENGAVSDIISLTDNSERTEYTMEPALLSSLFDKNREKRRLVKYDDIPPLLVHAVISIEDKRFFQHAGFDPIGMARAVWLDIRHKEYYSGASTLTQQLAKMLWLDNRKTFERKFAELMITIHLERKLTKQKIFEYYANEVDLGRRGSFTIRGFGEAAQAYFGKDLRQLSLDEAATLAGLIQQPSFRNPVRWPERARARRNTVLHLMLDNGYISKSQYEEAAAAPPVAVSKQGVESADAPYFVDLVNDRLGEELEDKDFQDSGSRIYTTLDTDLQKDAAQAVAAGMKEVDAILAKRHKNGKPLEEAQVALIAVDPHTGEVKALIGGRNYGMSQLDHVLAKRPSGSVFKPFVYAAALNTGLFDRPNPITASTTFEDEPHTFFYDGKPYEPTDYHKEAWKGTVTVREALADSLNVPTVEVAEATGYGAVAELAHRAGLEDIRATPAMALGAYDVTPLEIAGAYTTFANKGTMVQPRLIRRVVDKSGNEIWASKPEIKRVLDPRVTFLMVNLMQQVLQTGTGASVRALGFTLPAAGKTGTEHDAWFAGFTTKLLCVVWVGLDDYQDIKMQGAQAALPIWAEFMKLAHQHRPYRSVSDFAVPDGVVSEQIDPESGELATSACPNAQTEYYLLGTQPTQFCPLHRGGSTQIAGWDATSPTTPTAGAAPQPGQIAQPAATAQNAPPPVDPNNPNQPPPQKKRGFFDKLKSIFK